MLYFNSYNARSSCRCRSSRYQFIVTLLLSYYQNICLPGNPAHREARGLTLARVVDGRTSVLEILLLEHMPRELAGIAILPKCMTVTFYLHCTGSVLAHELCHALFHEEGFPQVCVYLFKITIQLYISIDVSAYLRRFM